KLLPHSPRCPLLPYTTLFRCRQSVLEWGPRPEIVAALRVLDLNDVSAGVGEKTARHRCSDHVGQLKDSEAAKRARPLEFVSHAETDSRSFSCAATASISILACRCRSRIGPRTETSRPSD